MTELYLLFSQEKQRRESYNEKRGRAVFHEVSGVEQAAVQKRRFPNDVFLQRMDEDIPDRFRGYFPEKV